MAYAKTFKPGEPNILDRTLEIIEAFQAFKAKGLVDYEVSTRTVLIDEWLWKQLDRQQRIAWVENATVWVAGQQPDADPQKETLHIALKHNRKPVARFQLGGEVVFLPNA